MSDQNQGTPEQQAGGFIDESAQEQQATAATTEAPKQAKPAGKGAELKANFMSVFGHGIGKAALVTVGIVVVVFAALGIRGLNKEQAPDKKAQVDVPGAPPTKINVDPIDEKEAERRAEQGAKEADAAARRGQTYQPDFIPAIAASAPVAASGANQALSPQPQLNVVVDDQPSNRAGQPPVPPNGQAQQGQAPQPVQVAVATGQGTANGGAGNQQNARAVAQQDEQRRQQAEYDRKVAARDKYVDAVRTGVKGQVEELMGTKGKEGGLHGVGTYSVVSYLPRAQNGSGSGISGNSATESGPTGSGSGSKQKPVFKAGKAIFATLDSEVNTDDGGDVFATVRGGPYDGSKLIGKIEQAPRNIRLRFSTLAPQDDRPTMTVNAIAIREEDAKEGVAETIDNHVVERYSALFFGSVLSGIGKAAMQPQGDTIVLPNGNIVVQNTTMSNKRIAQIAAGEIGTNAGQEVRKTFSEPPTYKTPANKGIGVLFLTDVNQK
jgi:intracellular multiplication protein IcmE